MNIKMYLLFLTLASCAYDNKTTSDQAKVDSLINVKKDSLLFLHFWSGMSEWEFKRVVAMENRMQNLYNGKFYFILGGGEDSVGFELTRPFDGVGIALQYSHEFWVKGGPNYPIAPMSFDGANYKEIKEGLKNHFDNKYSKLTPALGVSSTNVPKWITEGEYPKVIEMYGGYTLRDPSGSYLDWQFKEETGEYKWGYCNFTLTILSLHEYQERELKYIENKRLRREQEEAEKIKRETTVKEKNNRL